jgi:hypothetical protein
MPYIDTANGYDEFVFDKVHVNTLYYVTIQCAYSSCCLYADA